MKHIPKNTNNKKHHKVKYDKKPKGCKNLAFFRFGIQSMSANNITSAQIDAAYTAMNRHIKGIGKIIFRIYPHFAKTQKPIGVRMGSGKGPIAFYYFPVRERTIIAEIGNVSEKLAREAFKLGSIRLPLKTKFVIDERFN